MNMDDQAIILPSHPTQNVTSVWLDGECFHISPLCDASIELNLLEQEYLERFFKQSWEQLPPSYQDRVENGDCGE